jgi:hypothetical protein
VSACGDAAWQAGCRRRHRQDHNLNDQRFHCCIVQLERKAEQRADWVEVVPCAGFLSSCLCAWRCQSWYVCSACRGVCRSTASWLAPPLTTRRCLRLRNWGCCWRPRVRSDACLCVCVCVYVCCCRRRVSGGGEVGEC